MQPSLGRAHHRKFPVQVFSQAAKDPESTIVRLSFETVEKIVREHFTVITETDVGVFADCVNCLTCFTNQSHDDNVALNAIAFLRFCAMRLAEGSIGDVDNLPEEVRRSCTAFPILEAWTATQASYLLGCKGRLRSGVPSRRYSQCVTRCGTSMCVARPSQCAGRYVDSKASGDPL